MMQPTAHMMQAVNLTVVMLVTAWWTLMMGRSLSSIAPAISLVFMMSLLIFNIQKEYKHLSVLLSVILLAVFVLIVMYMSP
jgi:hypothetical protein